MCEEIANWIEWEWFDGYKGIDEVSIEHVWEMMKKGFTSGELCRLNKSDKEVRGWWKRREE